VQLKAKHLGRSISPPHTVSKSPLYFVLYCFFTPKTAHQTNITPRPHNKSNTPQNTISPSLRLGFVGPTTGAHSAGGRRFVVGRRRRPAAPVQRRQSRRRSVGPCPGRLGADARHGRRQDGRAVRRVGRSEDGSR